MLQARDYASLCLAYDNDGHEVGTCIAKLRIHEVPHDFVPLLIGQYLLTRNGVPRCQL